MGYVIVVLGNCTNSAVTAPTHTLESKVEAAYRRGDALEKRRALMTHWAEYVGGKDATLTRSSQLEIL